MKNIVKYLCIVGVFLCVVGGALYLIGALTGGRDYIQTFGSEKQKGIQVYQQEKTKIDPIQNMDITLQTMDFQIKKSEDENAYLEYSMETQASENPISITVQDGKLTVKENRFSKAEQDHQVWVSISFLDAMIGKGTYGTYQNRVILYLPETLQIKEGKISLSTGDAQIEDLTAEQLKVSMDCGDLKLSDTAAEDCEIESKSGDVKMEHLQTKKLNTNVIDGDQSVVRCTWEQAEVSLINGDLRIKLGDMDTQELSVDARTQEGDMQVSKSLHIKGELHEVDDHMVYQGADGRLKLNVNSVDGDILIQ